MKIKPIEIARIVFSVEDKVARPLGTHRVEWDDLEHYQKLGYLAKAEIVVEVIKRLTER